jgi:hypothetical protein
MPASAITLTAKGFGFEAGCVPAEKTSSRESKDRRNPSAIWLLHEFPVHKIKIFIVSDQFFSSTFFAVILNAPSFPFLNFLQFRLQNFQQQHPGESSFGPQSQLGSVPLRIPLIIPAAHPTPDLTDMAPSGQFLSHAPHSMQKSRFRITAFFSLIPKTAWGQTSVHILQPLHFDASSCNVTTSDR